jgi:hypothetical protein
MKASLLAFSAVVAIFCQTVRADFVGPSVATRAMSPNGDVLARLTIVAKATRESPKTRVKASLYQFDSDNDSYVIESQFEFEGYLPNLLYLSDAGDLALVNLGEGNAVRLYSKEGTLAGDWDLSEFLKPEEIVGCAKTGSTLQWFDSGKFHQRRFVFEGPAHRILGVSPPFTLMRGKDEKISFAGQIDAADGKLTLFPNEDEEGEAGDDDEATDADEAEEKDADGE